MQASDGNFYGTTFLGGKSNGGAKWGVGTVYKITPAGAETVLYSFKTTHGDGYHPVAGLIRARDGNFYGTTMYGGQWGVGTVFKITSAGVESVLYSFGNPLNPSDGSTPVASLLQTRDGNFYGTTRAGGAYNNGTIFKITPAGVETVLHSFGSVSGDGYAPVARLIQGKNGNFYGTTTATARSPHFGGTVFKVTPAGAEAVLHAFGTAHDDGTRPWANLVQARDGNFYGTTMKGGTDDEGTVYRITPAGVETVLHSFGGIKGDGREPEGSLIQARDGNLLGVTTAGGVAGHGTVFSITPTGAETVLHSFTGREGYYPTASLIRARSGKLYGTTAITFFSCTLRQSDNTPHLHEPFGRSLSTP